MSAARSRRRHTAAAALVGVLIAVAPATAQSPVPPPDFQIPKAETSPGTVTFSHARHMAAVGKCSLCHMRDLKMKRGASGITLAGKQEGKFCGACHDGKPGPGGRPVFAIDECDRCHRD
jgi:c(7)-type cytochrome triheme protein